MSDYIEVMVIVEGKTEEIFVNRVLVPYLSAKGIYLYPTQITKPGEKGGDVRFIRIKNDIEKHIKQRPDTYISTFVDYYGIKGDWPGLEEAQSKSRPLDIATAINRATKEKVVELFGSQQADTRFIPFIAVHEFETLLFSDAAILADELQVKHSTVEAILTECGEPELINNSLQTAPSKRLESLYSRFKKTSTGIKIAEKIGIDTMRKKCPVFNEWLTTLEGLINN